MAAYIILCLIVGVATFNVLGSLTMGVIEKRRDIGILKALGATRTSIIRIFMFEEFSWGSSARRRRTDRGRRLPPADRYSLFPLDPTVYIIPRSPSSCAGPILSPSFWPP